MPALDVAQTKAQREPVAARETAVESAKPAAGGSPAKKAARTLLFRRFGRHPERYLEIWRILRKYRLDAVAAQVLMSQAADDDDELQPAEDATSLAAGTNLAAALEELGPCFIKLGQLLSTRPDLLPASYIRALARLQDHIRPVPGEQIARIVEHDLGRPMGELFQSFDMEPLATASMAQVHRAVLPDGAAVAVKVQRPGVRRRVEVDLEVLRDVADFLTRHSGLGARYGLAQMVGELEHSLRQEIDFRQEADNTRLIATQIADFQWLSVPAVHPEYGSRRVLTLSFLHGRHLEALAQHELAAIDAPTIARDLLTAYLKQIAIDGIFHCDPHPGNILLTDEGRLGLIDFGMVGRFDSGQKDNIILFLLAFSERLGQRVAETYLDMVEVPQGFDRRAFTRDVAALVSRYHDMSGGRMAIGTALLDLTRLAHGHRIPVPAEMTLLGKTMLNLDGTVRVLSPELDPVQLIRDYMLEVMQQRVIAQLSPGRVFAWVLDMKHLFENSPRRWDTILDKLANDHLTLRLEVDRLDETLAGMNHAARRLSIGMIASSLIVAGGYVLAAGMRNRDRQ